MKILKRIMTVVLALSMTIGLCACGKAQSSSNGVKANKATKETALSKLAKNWIVSHILKIKKILKTSILEHYAKT